MALIAAHLNAGHSGGDSVAIGIYSPSSPTSIPPSPPSLISLMVSVDVKHHVYLEWSDTPSSDTLAAEARGLGRLLHHSAATPHTGQWSSARGRHAPLPTHLHCPPGHRTAGGSVPFQRKEVSAKQHEPQTKWIQVQVAPFTRCTAIQLYSPHGEIHSAVGNTWNIPSIKDYLE